MPTQLPFLLGLPVALFLLLAPGYVTLRFLLFIGKLRPSETQSEPVAPELNTAEKTFLTIALSVMLIGWLALLLAELGLFSIGAQLLIMATYVGGFTIYDLRFTKRTGFSTQRRKDAKTQRIYDLRFTIYDWVRTKLNQNPKSKIQNRFYSRPLWVFILHPSSLLVALLLAAGIFFFSVQHQTVVGAQDSGVYYATGVNVARTGGLVIHDPVLPLVAEPANQFLAGPGYQGRYLFIDYLRLSGFYVRDNSDGLTTGEVIPQFFHLFGAMLAVGYGLFGYNGPLLVTPLLGWLLVFGVVLMVQRMLPGRRGQWAGLLAGLLLALNGITVWFTRQTLSETLLGFLTFAGLFAFVVLVSAKDKATKIIGGVMAGAAFGLVGLAHPTFPIIIAPLVPYLVWMRLTRRWSVGQWWLLAVFTALTLHNIIHIRLFSLAYFEGVYHNDINLWKSRLVGVAAAGTIGLLALLVLDAMPGKMRAIGDWAAKRLHWLGLALAVGFTLYMLYNYFVRVYEVGTTGQGVRYEEIFSLQSYIGAPSTQGPERNLLRLGWYFSPPGILLMIVGLAIMLWKKLNARTAFFLCVALVNVLFFLQENYTQEGYIYSLRRYVNATVPAFCVFIAVACVYVLPNMGDWLGRTLARLARRQVMYAQTSGGPSANIAFIVTEKTEPQQTTPDNNSPTITIGRRLGNWTGLALAGVLVVFLVYTGRPVFAMAEYGASEVYNTPPVLEQLGTLAGRFDNKDVIVFSGARDQDYKVAAPLTYLYGHPSLVLTPSPSPNSVASILDKLTANGYTIKAMLGPNGGRFAPPGYELAPLGSTELTFHQLESLAQQKPNNAQDNQLSYDLYAVKRTSTGSFGAGSGAVTDANGWTLKLGQQDAAALVLGFYEKEEDKNADGTTTTYRWTGQDSGKFGPPKGVLRVPCLAPGQAAKLTLTLSTGIRPATLEQKLTVYLSNDQYDWDADRIKDGKVKPITTVTLQPGVHTYTLDVPAASDNLICKPGANSLYLQLDASPLWQPKSVDPRIKDTRALGVQVREVNITAK